MFVLQTIQKKKIQDPYHGLDKYEGQLGSVANFIRRNRQMVEGMIKEFQKKNKLTIILFPNLRNIYESPECVLDEWEKEYLKYFQYKYIDTPKEKKLTVLYLHGESNAGKTWLIERLNDIGFNIYVFTKDVGKWYVQI